jgi:hypothetical protein
MRTWPVWALLAPIASSACSRPPGTPPAPADFELVTPRGTAGVSVRQSSSDKPDAEWEKLVERGMQAVIPGSSVRPTVAPFPTLRVGWRVEPAGAPGSGVSRLVATVTVGSGPYAYEQQEVDNSAPDVVFVSTIAAITTRLCPSLKPLCG